MIAELTIVPIGEGTSLSDYVAEVTRIINASGMKNELHSMGTNVEGELDDIIDIVKNCHQALKDKGCKRISTLIKIDERLDKVSSMERKVKVVIEKSG
ncbi:MAG: MTH1187 family thiamine-binding protein [bacterium]|nr:MTH1187 family thiamine-binding protein [bacterium]